VGDGVPCFAYRGLTDGKHDCASNSSSDGDTREKQRVGVKEGVGGKPLGGRTKPTPQRTHSTQLGAKRGQRREPRLHHPDVSMPGYVGGRKEGGKEGEGYVVASIRIRLEKKHTRRTFLRRSD